MASLPARRALLEVALRAGAIIGVPSGEGMGCEAKVAGLAWPLSRMALPAAGRRSRLASEVKPGVVPVMVPVKPAGIGEPDTAQLWVPYTAGSGEASLVRTSSMEAPLAR